MRLFLLFFSCLVALPAFSQSYFIRFPSDVVTQNCDGSNYFGAPELYNPDSLPLVVEYYDLPVDGVPEACYWFERYWSVYNSATYNPNLACNNVPNPNPHPISHHPANLAGVVVSSIDTLGGPWSASQIKLSPIDTAKTNFSVFWSANPNCYVYKQWIKIFDGRGPEVDHCIPINVYFPDTTLNEPDLWNAPYWWDPPAHSQDLREGPLDISVAAYDSCSGTNVNARFLLYLDLDQNGTQETVINSSNPPPPGALFYDNTSNSGALRYFDQRPGVDSLRRYRFAIERVLGSNPVIFRLRWQEGRYPDTVLYSIPQLPPGLHRLKWYVQDGCGSETVCDYNFYMQGGPVSTQLYPEQVLKSASIPNPFREQTTIRFDLLEAGPVRLQIWNAAGQRVQETTSFFPAGEQFFTLHKTELGNTPGLYWYSLETGQSRAFGKMVLLP